MGRKKTIDKEPVTIRFKELANGNKSIYLDIYMAISFLRVSTSFSKVLTLFLKYLSPQEQRVKRTIRYAQYFIPTTF